MRFHEMMRMLKQLLLLLLFLKEFMLVHNFSSFVSLKHFYNKSILSSSGKSVAKAEIEDGDED